MGDYVAPALADLIFPYSRRGGGVFALALHRLQVLYPGAYSHGYKSAIVPTGNDYEGLIEVEEQAHIYIIPLSWAPECKAKDDPPTGRAHNIREIDNPQLGLHPPPGGHGPRVGELRWCGPLGPIEKERAKVDNPPPPTASMEK